MADELPYYPPVAPQVPVADHTAAKIIASGDIAGAFTRGFAAMAQATAARQRLQLESEQMVTDAALKSRQLDIARENNKLDFQVGMKNAEALANYRDTMAGINSDPTNPLGRLGKINIARERMETYADFNKRANDYGLLESNPKNPVDYYAKFQKLNDEFAFATDMPEIKNALSQFKLNTEQHTVPIKFGRVQDEDGEWKGGSETTKVPVGQIIENLNDSDKREETMRLLESNGLTMPVEKIVRMQDSRSWFDKWLGKGPAPTPVKEFVTNIPNESLSRYARMAAGVDFSRGKPRTPLAGVTGVEPTNAATSVVQSDVDQAAARLQSEQTPLPAKEELFPPTETDKLVSAYKRGKSKPGFNAAAARQFLIEKGIEPSLLDSE